MLKELMIAFGAALALVACLPTEPCACSPAPTAGLLLYGTVEMVRLPGTSYNLIVRGTDDESCPDAGARRSGADTTPLGIDGRYRLQLASYIKRAGPRCLQPLLFRRSSSGTDSVVFASFTAAFRSTGEPTDSLRFDIIAP